MADEVEQIEQAELRTTEVPIAGGGGSVLRQRVVRGPTMIRFSSITDEGLRSELHRLAEARRDPAIGRRDRGLVLEPIDLLMEDGATMRGVHVQRPLDGFGAVEVIAFNAAVPEH